MDPFEKLKNDVEVIKARNLRVEADKAWETSAFRRILILGTTYVLAAFVMWMIEVPNFLLSALIPTLGYFFSTVTFSVIKKRWIKRFLHTRA